MKTKIKNKMYLGFFFVFAVSILALAGITYAYKGDPNQKGPNYNLQVHELLESAIKSRDYDAWIKIRQENNLPMHGKIFQVINKDNFDKYSQMHEANIAGDKVTSDAIKSELGLGQGMMKKESGKIGCSECESMQKFRGSKNDGSFDICKIN